MSGSAVKTGFLEKKGVVRHNWLKRWFVLEQTEKATVLKYYKTQKDFEAKKPKGEISLLNAVLYAHVEKKGAEMPNYFNVRVGNRDFLIRAADADDKASWVKAIKAHIVKDDSVSKNPKMKKTPSFLGVVKETK